MANDNVCYPLYQVSDTRWKHLELREIDLFIQQQNLGVEQSKPFKVAIIKKMKGFEGIYERILFYDSTCGRVREYENDGTEWLYLNASRKSYVTEKELLDDFLWLFLL